MGEVTQIISRIESGDPSAADQLLPLVYQELRKLAEQNLASENPGQTLQATALVHEAYLRLVGTDTRWNSRGHFFAAAAQAMRRILIERARRKKAIRHGGNLRRQRLSEVEVVERQWADDLLSLDEALQKFAAEHPLQAQLVELRHFAGLTIKEAAQTLEISTTTADRYWAYARAWLHQEMTKGEVS